MIAALASTRVRFALVGVMFGALFPLAGILFERYAVGRSFSSPVDLILANPVHGIVALAPPVLGIAFWCIGHHYAVVQEQMLRALAAEESLWLLANRDGLTGKGNRNSLARDMKELIENGSEAYLLVVDLDRFKPINDTLGHNVGDTVLRATAERIDRELPKSAHLYRVGGDEFVVLAPGSDAATANDLAMRISECMDRPFSMFDARVASGCSIGITSIMPGDTMRCDLLARASFALQQARRRSGSRICFFTQAMSDDAHTRLQMEAEIRRGLAQDEFFMEFQPIVRLDANRVRGFEALVRWRHPELGRIPPDEFVPVAEMSGLIVELGERVLDLACMEATKWPAPTSVSVNVSMDQFKDGAFIDQVETTLARHGLAPGRLVLEITETVFSLDTEMLQAVFRRLRMMGVRFALDDFGTGYSSINHLRQFDLDYLKLDKSFTDLIATDPRERDLVRTIVSLGKRFSLTTTIEGVETDDQLRFMRDNGVDEVQGFIMARPLPAEDVMNYIIQGNQAGGAALQA